MKFAVVVMRSSHSERDSATAERETSGSVAAIGPEAVLSITARGRPTVQARRRVTSHAEAVRWALEALSAQRKVIGAGTEPRVDAVGHRVVHGGLPRRGRDDVRPADGESHPRQDRAECARARKISAIHAGA